MPLFSYAYYLGSVVSITTKYIILSFLDIKRKVIFHQLQEKSLSSVTVSVQIKIPLSKLM